MLSVKDRLGLSKTQVDMRPNLRRASSEWCWQREGNKRAINFIRGKGNTLVRESGSLAFNAKAQITPHNNLCNHRMQICDLWFVHKPRLHQTKTWCLYNLKLPLAGNLNWILIYALAVMYLTPDLSKMIVPFECENRYYFKRTWEVLIIKKFGSNFFHLIFKISGNMTKKMEIKVFYNLLYLDRFKLGTKIIIFLIHNTNYTLAFGLNNEVHNLYTR